MGNPVMHWQIISKNPDKQGKFYAKLFGWEIQANNALGYRMIDTGSDRGINGGIWPAPPGANGFVQLLVEVDDIKRHVQEAVSAGATVIVPPQKLPDGDEMAILQDPDGLSFGLCQTVRG